MAWTYKFDRIDPEVMMDTQKYGRASFYRYLYFQPDNYVQWSKTGKISGMNYSAQILDSGNIPQISSHLSGSLSAYYAASIQQITNMNTQDNPQAVSYGVVKILYENMPAPQTDSDSSASSSASSSGSKQPWTLVVQDFTQTPYEISTPFKLGWDDQNHSFSIPVQNSARQALPSLTTTIYGSKISWSYNTRSSTQDYSHTYAWVNTNNVTIGDSLVTIPAYTGLFLPPSRKRLWFIDPKKQTRSTPYYVWTFEIIVNPMGHYLQIFDAGTKMLDSTGAQVDICTWYVDDPTVAQPIVKHYGTVQDMIAARNAVMLVNKTRANDQKQTFTGDFLQNDIPLTSTGAPDLTAIAGTTPKRTLTFYKYLQIEILSSNLGWR